MSTPLLRPASTLLLSCALVIVSCSSAPPRTDTVTDVKKEASQLAVAGESYFRQGRYDLALQFFSQALNGYTSVDDVNGALKCTVSIGQVYLATDRVDEAAVMFTRARERARALSTPLFIDSSISLGELYLRKRENQKALEIFQDTLAASGAGAATGPAAAPAQGPPGAAAPPPGTLTPEQRGVLYHDLGVAYKAAGDYSKALESLNRSLQLNLAARLSWQAAADYYMIASVHSKQEDYPAAARNAQAALDLDKKIENSPGIAQDLRALGLIARKRGDGSVAYDYFQRSYLVFSALGMKGEMRKALGDLAETADSLGLTADAQRYRALLAQTGSP
ncbi:MAG TPA: tetratricopeptide repeat protein [Spirochaetia bacterium]|nr:tetratricopeptide repeat protein [Spirochaetia bacterium]